MAERTPGRTLGGENNMYEEMSKDELVGQVKKQLILLKKSKQKIDDLNKKCSNLQNVEVNPGQQLQVELENLKKEYESSVASNLKLQQVHDDLCLKHEELNETFMNECKKHEENLHNLSSNHEQMECMKMKMETMDTSFQCLQDEIVNLQKTLKDKEKTIDELENERSKMRSEISNLKSETESHSDVISRYETLLADFKELEIEKQSFQMQIQNEMEKTVKLEHDFDELNKDRNLQLETLQKESEDFKDTIASLNYNLKLMEERAGDEQVQTKTELLDFKENNRRLTEELEKLKNENQDLNVKLEALESETMDKVTEIGQLELKTALNDKLSEIEFLNESVEKMSHANEELENERKRNAETLSQLDDRVALLLSEKAELQQEILQDRELIRFLEDEANSLNDENKKVKADMSILEDAVEKDAQQIAEFDLKLHDMQDREQRTSRELDDLRNKFADSAKDRETLVERLKNVEVIETDDEVAQLRFSNEQLSEKVMMLERHRNALDNKVTELEETIDRLAYSSPKQRSAIFSDDEVDSISDECHDDERCRFRQEMTELRKRAEMAAKFEKDIEIMKKTIESLRTEVVEFQERECLSSEQVKSLNEQLMEANSKIEESTNTQKMPGDMKCTNEELEKQTKLVQGHQDVFPDRVRELKQEGDEEGDESSNEEKEYYKDEISLLHNRILTLKNLLKRLSEDVASCKSCKELDLLASVDAVFNSKDYELSAEILVQGGNDLNELHAQVEAKTEDHVRVEEEMASLEDLLKASRMENENLKVSLEEKQAMVFKLHYQLDDWICKTEELSSLLEDRQKNISHLESRLLDLQSDTENKRNTIEQLTADKASLQTESKSLKDRLNEQTRICNLELEPKIQCLEHELEVKAMEFEQKSNQDRDTFQKERESLTEDLKISKDCLNELQMTYDGLSNENHTLKSKVQCLEQELEIKLKELERVSGEKYEENDILRKERQSLEADLKISKEHMNEFQVTYDRLKDENETLKSQNEELCKESNKLQRALDVLERKKMDAENELKSRLLEFENERSQASDKSHDENEVIQKECNGLKESLKASNDRLNELQATYDQLNNENESLKLQNSDSSIKLNELKHMLENVSSSSAALEHGNADLKVQMENIQRMEEENRQELDKKSNENDILKKEKESLEESFKMAKEHLNELQGTNAGLKEEKESLKLQNRELCVESNKLQELIENLERKQMDTESELKNKLLEFENERRQTSGQNHNEDNILQEECESLKLQNCALSAELNEMKLMLDNVQESSANLELEINQLKTKLEKSRQADEELQQKGNKSQDEMQEKLKDAETKLVKVKTFAVKTKKELAEAKQKILEIGTERDQLLSKLEHLNQESNSSLTYLHNYQSLQTEYDKAQDKIEEEKLRSKNFEQDLQVTIFELSNLKAKLATITEQKQNLLAESEKFASEKLNLVKTTKEFEAKIMCLDEEKKQEKKKYEALQIKLDKASLRIEEANKQLKEEQRKSAKINEKLNENVKENKKRNVIDLEIADYEKTVSNLQTEIHVKNCNIQELNDDTQHLQDRIASLQEQINCLEVQKCDSEAHSERMKDLLEKSKRELTELQDSSADDSRKIFLLQEQLEEACQQVENHKVQISQLAVEKRNLEETNEVLKESHQMSVKSSESKIQLLQNNLRLAEKEKESCQRDFECYKTRVHSVYKQQKKQSNSTNDDSKETEKRMQEIIDQFKGKIEEVSTKLSSAKYENETLQVEFDRLLERNTQLSKELEEGNAIWTTKLETIARERDQIIFENKEIISCLQMEIEKLYESHKKQLDTVSDDHKQSIEKLQNQIDIAEDEIARLRRGNMSDSHQKVQNSKEEESVPDITLQERQEGEGSECTEIHTSTPQKPTSLPLVHGTGFLPLEQLIEPSTVPLSPAISLSSSVQESEVLSNKLSSSIKKIDHLSELLNEAEENNMRLSEQTIVLKKEIRRLERNREREEHSENLEYMKNVILKYLTISTGDEKLRLVPVLTTMLRLSPDEKKCLNEAAGGDSTTVDSSTSAGWGSMLHRWSGLS